MNIPKKACLTIALALILSACEITPPDSRTEAEKLHDENGSFLGLNKNASGISDRIAGNTIMINAYLWQASLDTLSVLPIDTAEPQAGFIQTEWADTNTPNTQIRFSALVISGDLMATGVRANVYRRVMKNNRWEKIKVPQSEINTLTNAILQRARELRIADKKVR